MTTELAFPRLRGSVIAVPVDGGVVIDGLQRLECIRGVAADTLLPVLLKKLDGSRSIDDLSRELGSIPKNYLTDTLDLLKSLNLLVDGKQHYTLPLTSVEVMLERYDVAFRGSNHKLSSKDILAASSVTIGASPILSGQNAERLATHLLSCGVPKVDLKTYSPNTNNCGQLACIVLRRAPEHVAFGSQSGEMCLYVGVSSSGSVLQIGPVVDGEQDGCLDCCEEAAQEVSTPANLRLGAKNEIGAAVIAWEITDLLLSNPSRLRRSRVREYDLKSVSHRTLYYPCHRLLRSKADCDVGLSFFSLACVYNDRIADESLQSIAEVRHVYEEAQQSPCSFPASTRYPLPRSVCDLSANALSVLVGQSTIRKKRLTLGSLAVIAQFGVGLRRVQGERTKRWAPSAGNLGSAKLHVFTTGEEQLPAGLYSYDDASHELFVRQSGLSLSGKQLCGKVRKGAEVGTFLILTTQRDLLFRKYRDFSYKLSNLDAGVIYAQLDFVASALGVVLRPCLAWSEDVLNKELNLRDKYEQVTIVLECERRNWLPARRKSPQILSGVPVTHLADFFYGMSTEELTKQLVTSNTLPHSEFFQGTDKYAVAINPKPYFPIRLGSLPRTERSVADVLNARVSVRSFGSSSFSPEQIHAIIKVAYVKDKAAWSSLDGSHQPLSFTLLLRSYSEHAVSVFSYIPERDCLQECATSIANDRVKDMFVQPEFANATITIIIGSQLETANLIYGTSAYRMLLLRAGAAAHRMWLAGIALSLVGTIHAGLKPSAIRLNTMASSLEAPLLACSLGKALYSEEQA